MHKVLRSLLFSSLFSFLLILLSMIAPEMLQVSLGVGQMAISFITLGIIAIFSLICNAIALVVIPGRLHLSARIIFWILVVIVGLGSYIALGAIDWAVAPALLPYLDLEPVWPFINVIALSAIGYLIFSLPFTFATNTEGASDVDVVNYASDINEIPQYMQQLYQEIFKKLLEGKISGQEYDELVTRLKQLP